MSTAIVTNSPPYTVDQIENYKAEFARDGYLLLPGVLNEAEITELKAGFDRVFTGDEFADNRYADYVAVRLFETSRAFVDMLTREPIISLVESILGPNCHLIAQNAVRNRPGQAIDFFHVDDLVIAPLPEDIPRHDPRVTLPQFLVTVQIPLTDIPAIEYGPTEFVPGSHYSGRQPNDTQHPEWEGQAPVPILCKAGDIYLHNGQCWHRGAPNTSDRTRYLLQMAFGMRFISQRFYPFVNYQLPQHVMDNADARLLRVLGFHNKGAYG